MHLTPQKVFLSLRFVLKSFSAWTALSCVPLFLHAAQPWQELSIPTVAETASSFANPPKEYGIIYWATGFPPPKERIISDITNTATNGGSLYMINSGGRSVKYLSPEYFDLMKVAMDQLKQRGMKMWIDGDDGYPDGLAGGLIRRDYPQLGMQGIVADARLSVAGGQSLDIPLPVDTLGILVNPLPGDLPSSTPAPIVNNPAPATAPVPAAVTSAGTGRGARAGGGRPPSVRRRRWRRRSPRC